MNQILGVTLKIVTSSQVRDSGTGGVSGTLAECLYSQGWLRHSKQSRSRSLRFRSPALMGMKNGTSTPASWVCGM